MDKQVMVESVAYCGLVCSRCGSKDQCAGCRSTSKCGDCYHRRCCLEKGIQGCWECSDFPCGKEMYHPSRDPRVRAFVQFVKEDGLDALVGCLLHNEELGIHYSNGGYDNRSSEAEVIQLLKTGRPFSDGGTER